MTLAATFHEPAQREHGRAPRGRRGTSPRRRARALATILALFVSSFPLITSACNGGEAQLGHLSASFQGSSFATTYGIATAGYPFSDDMSSLTVIVGNVGLECGDSFDTLGDGSYAIGAAGMQAVGSYTDPDGQVAVVRIAGASFEWSSDSGTTITVDSLDAERVRGTMTLMDSMGTSVSGTYDVRRCF